MLLRYKAISKSGETREATVEAKDQYELARSLRERGETLVFAEEATERSGHFRFLEQLHGLTGRVSARDKIIFTRNLSAMLEAGLTISRGLEVMERQTHNKRFQSILEQVRTSVQEGNTLSVSLGTFGTVFPPLFISMIKAGEESGKLSESLENLGLQMQKTYQLKKRIRGAMIYPAIVITAMIIVGVVMLVFVVPTLTSTFEELNVELPKSTQAIIGTSNFIKNHTLTSLLIVILVGAAGVLAFRHPRGRRAFEWVILHIPVIGELVRFTNAARTARTMGSLLHSGVEIVTTVGITRDVIQNSYFKEVLAHASEQIPKGGVIAESFSAHEDLYPPLMAEMVSVGEETGNLSEMLGRVADFYEAEIDERTKNLSTIIEPLLMIIIGAVVGFFAVSMISPIYSVGTGL